jgi:hypothetical protein
MDKYGGQLNLQSSKIYRDCFCILTQSYAEGKIVSNDTDFFLKSLQLKEGVKMQVSKEAAEAFLNSVKEAIRNGKYTLIPREKNRKSMAQHGLLLKDVLDEVCNLSYANYIRGPEPDDDPNEKDAVWVFKTYIVTDTFYVKIKIVSSDQSLKILSFHISEY